MLAITLLPALFGIINILFAFNVIRTNITIAISQILIVGTTLVFWGLLASADDGFGPFAVVFALGPIISLLLFVGVVLMCVGILQKKT